jgi:hypothetical protein
MVDRYEHFLYYAGPQSRLQLVISAAIFERKWTWELSCPSQAAPNKTPWLLPLGIVLRALISRGPPEFYLNWSERYQVAAQRDYCDRRMIPSPDPPHLFPLDVSLINSGKAGLLDPLDISYAPPNLRNPPLHRQGLSLICHS